MRGHLKLRMKLLFLSGVIWLWVLLLTMIGIMLCFLYVFLKHDLFIVNYFGFYYGLVGGIRLFFLFAFFIYYFLYIFSDRFYPSLISFQLLRWLCLQLKRRYLFWLYFNLARLKLRRWFCLLWHYILLMRILQWQYRGWIFGV